MIFQSLLYLLIIILILIRIPNNSTFQNFSNMELGRFKNSREKLDQLILFLIILILFLNIFLQ
jgi:hypothetical protein